MRWHKTAEWGHGDTLDGQLMARTYRSIKKDLEELKLLANANGPESVTPRWRGEIRRKILLLPPVERVSRMSMHELGEVKAVVDEVRRLIGKYDSEKLGPWS